MQYSSSSMLNCLATHSIFEHVNFTSLSPTNEHQRVQLLAHFVRAKRQRQLMMQQMLSKHVRAKKCIVFLLRAYLSPISVSSTCSHFLALVLSILKNITVDLQTLRCRFHSFQFSNTNGWRTFDGKDAGT